MARPMFRPIVLSLQRVPTWPGNVIPIPDTPAIPVNAVTYNSEAVTYTGEIVTYQGTA